MTQVEKMLFEEGWREGWNEGWNESDYSKAKEIALRMFERHYSCECVAEVLELPMDVVHSWETQI